MSQFHMLSATVGVGGRGENLLVTSEITRRGFGKNEGSHPRFAETMTSRARLCLRRCNGCGVEIRCRWTTHTTEQNGVRTYCGFMRVVRERRKAENGS